MTDPTAAELRRASALKLAEDLVNRLDPPTNGRAYSSTPATLSGRVGEILRIAAFLDAEPRTNQRPVNVYSETAAEDWSG